MKKLISVLFAALLLCSVFMQASCEKFGDSSSEIISESGNGSSDSVGGGSEDKEDLPSGRYTFDKGVHVMTAPEIQGKYIVEKGATDYVLVVPANANSKIELAVDEFKVLFKRATNIEIASVRDDSGDPVLTDDNAKRISIGETSLITSMSQEEQLAFGYDKSILGSDGVRIITKNNTVYILGGSFYGVLYSVYDFMAICFNYEFYYRNCIEIDTNVKNLNLRDFNVTNLPDVASRNHGNNITLFKDAWGFELDSGVVDSSDIKRAMQRYRYIDTVEIFLPIYTEIGETSYNYGSHNVYNYVHPTSKEGWRNTWLSDAAPANNPMYQELCYTAHGNKEDLDALVEACANKIIYSLTLDAWKDRSYVGFTIMDGGFQCTCAACEEAKVQDGGSYAGAIIRVANRMMEIVKEWMKNNGQADRELNLFFLAYGTTEKAPVVYDEAQGKYVPANDSVICRDDVYAYLCTHNDARSISWAEGENKADIEELEKWCAVTNHVFNWFYQQRYVNYSAYFDTFSMSNNDFFAYALQNGATYIINQGDYRGETVTGFGLLNEYVFSKLMWDVNLDMEELCKKFFKAMYKDAADTMWEIFTRERIHSMTVSQDVTVGEYNYSRPRNASLYPYKSYLLPLIELYEKALSEIEILKLTSPDEYELVRQRINTEYVAPLYLTLSLYGSREVRPFSNEIKIEYKTRLTEIAETMYFLCYESNPIGPNMLDFAKGV